MKIFATIAKSNRYPNCWFVLPTGAKLRVTMERDKTTAAFHCFDCGSRYNDDVVYNESLSKTMWNYSCENCSQSVEKFYGDEIIVRDSSAMYAKIMRNQLDYFKNLTLRSILNHSLKEWALTAEDSFKRMVDLAELGEIFEEFLMFTRSWMDELDVSVSFLNGDFASEFDKFPNIAWLDFESFFKGFWHVPVNMSSVGQRSHG